MTRTGKIARLPRTVRDELNRRLHEGEPGIRLVEWLNAKEEVRAVLNASFGGRPISEQNLSEWKQGGYEDWRRHQETVEQAGRILEEAEDFENLSEGGLLADRFAEMAALALARMLRATMEKEDGPDKRRATLEIVRELVQLRRTDRAWERAQREEEIHERTTDEYWEKKKREIEGPIEDRIALMKLYYDEARKMKSAHEAKGEPVPAAVSEFLATEEKFLADNARWLSRRPHLSML